MDDFFYVSTERSLALLRYYTKKSNLYVFTNYLIEQNKTKRQKIDTISGSTLKLSLQTKRGRTSGCSKH